MDTQETKKQGFFATCPLITHYIYFPLSHPYLMIAESLMLILSLSWIAYCVTYPSFNIYRHTEFEGLILMTIFCLWYAPIVYFVWAFTIALRILLTLSHWIGSIRHIK